MFSRYQIVIGPILFVVMLAAGLGVSHLHRDAPTQHTAVRSSDSRTHDFGTVRACETIQHSFTLENPGREPLTIENVQTTCGCTVAGVESKVIAPGESVEMPVTLDTKGRSGALSQSVTVSFSTGEPRGYTMRGFVSSDELKPVHFGTVLRGDVSKKELSLKWPPGMALDISEIHFNEAKLTVEVTPGEGAHTIAIALREDIPYGPLSESVIMHTNDPLVPEKHVNIFGIVSYPVICDPDEVTLGLVQPAKPATGTARIVSPYRHPLRIDSIEQTEGQAVEWREERVSEIEVLLHLSLFPEAERSYYKAVLRVYAAAGEEERSMNLEIYGVGTDVDQAAL